MDDSFDLLLKLYQVPEIDNNLFKTTFKIDSSIYIAQPLFSLGFNYYIYQAIDKFNEVINEQKLPFYWVVSGFEIKLNDQIKANDLISNIEKYFNINDKMYEDSIFVKMWDILIVNNIIINKSIINIISENNEIIKKIINLYNNKISKIIQETNKIEYSDKQYNIGIIYNNYNFNTREAESIYFNNILFDTYNIIKNLDNYGNILIRIGDTFTKSMLKFICLLKYLFENIFIYKPYYSRLVDSEKFLICKFFIKKNFDKIDKQLEKSIKSINKNLFIIDFMSDMPVFRSIEIIIKYINLVFSGIQHKEKNKIIKYIKSENYYGIEFHEYSEKQSKYLEYFISRFLPIDINDYNDIQQDINKYINKNIDKIKDFTNTLLIQE